MRKNSHDAETKKYTLDLLAFCNKIEPCVAYYRWQIKSYNNTVHYSEKGNWSNFTTPTFKTEVC